MRKLFFLLTIILFPFLSKSQASNQNKINWISLKKAQEYSKKYDQNILVFFYKQNCEYCDKMKNETLSDPEIVDLINSNFLPVKINGYTKEIITFNGEKYINEQPADKGKSWRHDFYFKYGRYNDGIINPTFVLFNSKLEKITQLTGYQPKSQFLRGIKRFTK